MPLPAATIPIEPIAGPSKRAYVIRLPQDTLDALQDAQEGEAKVWMDGGVLKIDLPGDSIPLEAHTVEPSEIHLLSSYPAGLRRLAIASTRLSVPLSSRSASKAGEKLKQSIAALDDAKSARAAAVAGQKAPKPKAIPPNVPVTAPMGRVQSSPAATIGAGSGPVLPLKTRVMQLLALGPIAAPDLIEKVAGNEVDVMRVVNVVGRSAGTPPKFSLQPQQYAKIKIGAWKYTQREQLQVIGLARQAYDELGMAGGTPERAELDRLEQEAQSSLSTASETNGQHEADESAGSAVHETNGNGLTSSRSSAGSGSGNGSGKSSGGRSGSPSASSSASSRTSANASNHAHPPPRTSTPRTSTSPEKSKKGSSKAPKTLIGKAKAKHLAEQKRASSMPNIKDAGAALNNGQVPLPSPQRPLAAETKSGKHAEPLSGDSVPSPKRKRSPISVDGEPKRAVKPKKRPTPDYSSSSGSEDEEERGRGRPPGPKVTSSSTSPPKPRTPPEPELNGHRILPDIKKRSKTRTDEERKRDRYDKLYGRYSELTRRLVGVHRGMEELEEGEDLVMGDAEMQDLVEEWKDLHEQLSELRTWFVEIDP